MLFCDHSADRWLMREVAPNWVWSSCHYQAIPPTGLPWDCPAVMVKLRQRVERWIKDAAASWSRGSSICIARRAGPGPLPAAIDKCRLPHRQRRHQEYLWYTLTWDWTARLEMEEDCLPQDHKSLCWLEKHTSHSHSSTPWDPISPMVAVCRNSSCGGQNGPAV